MKKELLELINKTNYINSLFIQDETFGWFSICYNYEFISWKEKLLFELESIVNYKNNDTLIDNTILLIKSEWNGISDRKDFDMLEKNLNELSENIENYFPKEIKNTKIFISHIEKDKDFIQKLGLNDRDILPYPKNKNLFDYLKEISHKYEIYVIYILSNEYYENKASLQEMGALWVLQKEYSTFMLDNIDINNSLNPTDKIVDFNNSEKMNAFKNGLIDFLN